MQIHAATCLDDVYKTLSPEPLLTPEEFNAFYRDDLNRVRGDDKVARLALGLNRAFGGSHYKAFLMGHSGVGKSTEMTRLIGRMEGKYRVIRFSATSELDPTNFQPFDILLLMMALVAEKTASPVAEGGAGKIPPASRLQEIEDWFNKETNTYTQERRVDAEASAGIGPKAESLWAKALGLFASLKGEIKYASVRKNEVVEHRLNRLSSLIEMVNQLIDDCNQLLRDAAQREWLFICEDFDKGGIPIKQIETLFLTYRNIFEELHAHLIFTIPISLGYAAKAVFLPFPQDHILCLPDTPVYQPDHTPHLTGRAAIRVILEARVKPDLFADNEMERLIVASGGNLRDLFTLVSQAADNALLRPAAGGKIERPDSDYAIIALRTDYERRLGEGPYDDDKVTYEEKAQRMIRIYQQDATAKVPDPILYALLRSRAVQEFNGERWFGVHPLVVDILSAQGKISRTGRGTVAGGTE